MMRLITFLFFICCVFLLLTPARAADIRHSYGGDELNSFYIDDRGGSVDNGGSDLSYYLNLQDVDQSAFGTLLLFRDSGSQAVADGLVDQDFLNGSSIQLFDLASTLPGTTRNGEIGVADDAPLTPVSFHFGALTVEQVSYTSSTPGDHFVIVEYRVVNDGASTAGARLALSNDFDVDQKSIDAAVGFSGLGIPFVYQQEAPPLDPNYTTVAVGLIRGQLAQYRLESCDGALGACEIFADDADQTRLAFFNGVAGEIGDLTQGASDRDFAVTIAAQLGNIPPGEGRSAVFCYHLGSGSNSGDALASCSQAATDCETFYEEQIAICSNGLINFGEECDDGDSVLNDSCPSGPAGTCQDAFCGDGYLWNTDGGTELCDDGDNAIDDSCPSGPSGNCQPAVCGDGFIWDTDGGTESCDDGDNDEHDSCPSGPSCECQPARCGDGYVWNTDGGAESCDDGNDAVTDACPSGPAGNCQPASCGDGHVHQGVEACDDGNLNVTDGCPSGPAGSCQPASCGDGFVRQGFEVCDPGLSGASCINNCGTFTSCGNGVLNPGESCDDGNNNVNDACPDGPTRTCQTARCGDGYLQLSVEECDDGNHLNGDGCSTACHSENPSAPNNPPPPPVCGNAIVESGEDCDGGNGCEPNCTFSLVLQGGGTSESVNPSEAGGCSLSASKQVRISFMDFAWIGLAIGLLKLRIHSRNNP